MNQNLPGFVVLTDGGEVTGGARNWGTGYMPATYQGTLFRPGDSPILNLDTSERRAPTARRAKLELIQQAQRDPPPRPGRRHAPRRPAGRLRTGLPHAGDRPGGRGPVAGAGAGEGRLRAQPQGDGRVRHTAACWPGGWSSAACGSCRSTAGPAAQWDAHGDLEGNHTRMCARADQPTAALLSDLKARGLLDDTLVIWGGEFGRTPMTEGKDGRDHNPYGFTMLLAGGGVKGGHVHGTTDEFGLYGVDGKRPRPRLPRDDPAPARLRPREADVPPQRPRRAADRRRRQGGEGRSEMTPFDPTKYPPPLAALWAIERLPELGPGSPNESVATGARGPVARTRLSRPSTTAKRRSACISGLWLYHDFLDESHTISQDLPSWFGSYWHGIMHRREPDASNAKYWFRRVPANPVFEALAADAPNSGSRSTGQWDPFAFVDRCETRARHGDRTAR